MLRTRARLLVLVLSAACTDKHPDSVGELRPEWLSDPDYQFGDALAGNALFGFVPYLRVSADGQRVFVLEPNAARVSVWSPTGRLLLDLGGPGEGPGDFMGPFRIHVEDSLFYVRDQVRFTYFSDGGVVLRTVPNPPTSVSYQGFHVRVHALLADNSFLGVPSIPASIKEGLTGDDPMERTPVLRVRDSPEGWIQEAVAWTWARDSRLVISGAHDDAVLFAAQPYSEADYYGMDPGAGTVVVARKTGGGLEPGEAEFLEISATGDTVWRRRLKFRPIRLTRAMLDATIDRVVVPTLERTEEGDPGFLGGRSAREVAEDALHAPEHLPALRRFTLASSGHVWLESHESIDTLKVWYSIERGDTESPPRRVLLPEWFRVMDATDTHVWGVWKNELDINYIVGRRLAPR